MAPEQWDRVARVHDACRVMAMARFVRASRSGWVVRVHPRLDPDAAPLNVENDSLLEALTDAAAQAEALGWVHAALPAG